MAKTLEQIVEKPAKSKKNSDWNKPKKVHSMAFVFWPETTE